MEELKEYLRKQIIEISDKFDKTDEQCQNTLSYYNGKISEVEAILKKIKEIESK